MTLSLPSLTLARNPMVAMGKDHPERTGSGQTESMEGTGSTRGHFPTSPFFLRGFYP